MDLPLLCWAWVRVWQKAGHAGGGAGLPLASLLRKYNLQSKFRQGKEGSKEGRNPLGFPWRGGQGGWCRKRPGLALLIPAALDRHGHVGSLAEFPMPHQSLTERINTLQLQWLWDPSCLPRSRARPGQAGSLHLDTQLEAGQ